MPIKFTCDCGRSFQVKEEFAGRRARCAACGQIMTVPAATANEEEALAALLSEEQTAQPVPSRRERGHSEEEGPRRLPPRPPQLPQSFEVEDVSEVREVRKPRMPRKSARAHRERSSGPSVVISPGVVTGLLMMLGAAAWFFIGLAVGYIFFYPPILFILGFATMIKGFCGGDD